MWQKIRRQAKCRTPHGNTLSRNASSTGAATHNLSPDSLTSLEPQGISPPPPNERALCWRQHHTLVPVVAKHERVARQCFHQAGAFAPQWYELSSAIIHVAAFNKPLSKMQPLDSIPQLPITHRYRMWRVREEVSNVV